MCPGGSQDRSALGKGRTEQGVAASAMLDPEDVAGVVLMACTQSPHSRIIEVQMRTMEEASDVISLRPPDRINARVRIVYEAIVALLTARGISFTIHEHVPTQTFAEAMERLTFPAERLLKTIAFKTKIGSHILAAVRGQDRIDYRKLAAASGTRRTEIFRLTPEEVADVFGVEVGSVNPLALQEGVTVFFDTQVPVNETVFCGIGRPDRTLEIRLMDLVQITQGQILPLISDVM